METIVLLRGLLRDSRHWGDFPAQLQNTLPGYQVLCLDLPGNGSQYAQRSPASIPSMVDALREQLSAEQRQQGVHLLTISMGGMIGSSWASQYPAEIKSLCMMNASFAGISPFYRRLKPKHYPRILRLFFLGGRAVQKELFILRATSLQHNKDLALAHQWADFSRSYPVSLGNALRQLWAAARFRISPQKPALPMLVLNGGADDLVHPSCSMAISLYWHLPLRSQPFAGHDLPLDAATWVCHQLQHWYGKLRHND